MFTALPGQTYPLGATFDGEGTNFAIFSAHASKVELCIFDATGSRELQRLTLPTYVDEVFCTYVPGLGPGTLYGYRCHGPFSPHEGHRFNPAKLLLDPYARKLNSDLKIHPRHYGYMSGDDMLADDRDSASVTPKCVVIDEIPNTDSVSPQIHPIETVIFELHVKGFTKTNTKIPAPIRGTYKALAHSETIKYLKELGVTSIELLPVHASCSEPFLEDKGLTNYWGYNSYSFFVIDARFAKGDAFGELKEVVDAMHHAGIEVILDVVYNHTAEGNHLGPTFCFKGIDNYSYYHLLHDDRRFYANHSGCGNSLNVSHPRVLQLVMDSLRYLVNKIGVDGFRFDLASALARGSQHYFSTHSHFFTVIAQDPCLAHVKLIAEPWDIGFNGYQVGHYPNRWHEWNDKFRDTVRRFWRGDRGTAPEFAKRLHGSSDLFERHGRSPYASINFISSHDGFTLKDIVSYNERHNIANGEDNRDGHGANFSCNHGIEGASNDPAITALRHRQQKNFLTTLLLSQGIPMLLAGDEFGNSQQGNNNAYCQDNEISWLNWGEIDQLGHDLLEFSKSLIRLRRLHPLLNRNRYQHGKFISSKTGLPDISWINREGTVMTEKDWHDENCQCFGILLATTGETLEVRSSRLACSIDDALLLIFNSSDDDSIFTLPTLEGLWEKILYTGDSTTDPTPIPQQEFSLLTKSCAVLSYTHTQNTK